MSLITAGTAIELPAAGIRPAGGTAPASPAPHKARVVPQGCHRRCRVLSGCRSYGVTGASRSHTPHSPLGTRGPVPSK